jgi:hypothetical protein
VFHNGAKSAGQAAASMLFCSILSLPSGGRRCIYCIYFDDLNPWLYPAEATMLHIRSKGAACSTMSNGIFKCLVVEIVRSAIATIGYQTIELAQANR